MRQVVGYWSMAASLVLRGALNEDLARDNFQELLFVYARLEPFLAEVRKRTGMENFGAHMQKFVEGSPEAQERVSASSSVSRRCRPRAARPAAPNSDIRECRDRCSAATPRRSPRR